MREKINKRIDDLMSKYSALSTADNNAAEFNQEIEFTQTRLREALNATASFDTKDQLSSFIFEDKDPINKLPTENISRIESFVESVRDIQNDILDEFIEFCIARGIDLLENKGERNEFLYW